jgi:pimeloyl-ACP methyl ester carboxylesterase
MMERNGYCDVGHGSLYYEAVGSGPPVVFIQGFGLNLTYWDGVFPVFASDCLTVRYDRRGFGRSSEPRQDAPYSDFDDLHKLLEFLNLGEVHLVTQCVGSHVALEFVLEYPERVTTLTLTNPDAGPGVAGVNEAFFKIVEDTRPCHAAGDLCRASELAFSSPIIAPALHSDATRFRLMRALAGFKGWQYLHWYPRRSCDPPVPERLGEVGLPTLVVSGGKDYVYFRKVADVLASSIPEAQAHALPDAGHFACLEYPDETGELILDFLQHSYA